MRESFDVMVQRVRQPILDVVLDLKPRLIHELQYKSSYVSFPLEGANIVPVTLYLRVGNYRVGQDIKLSIVISTVSVYPEHWRKGWFKAIISACEDVARSTGLECVDVENVLVPELEQYLVSVGFVSDREMPPKLRKTL